jgi:putative ABC transport system substrate-binding protein
MKRREFIALVSSATAAWPLVARAQQPATGHAQSPVIARRIGVLRLGEPPPSYILPFRQALSRLGYVEGQNLVIEYGSAQDVDGLPEMARDLVRRNVDVILASGVPSVVSAQTASTTPCCNSMMPYSRPNACGLSNWPRGIAFQLPMVLGISLTWAACCP